MLNTGIYLNSPTGMQLVASSLFTLLGSRSLQNSYSRLVLGTYLYSGGAQRQIIDVLAHLGITSTYTSIVGKGETSREDMALPPSITSTTETKGSHSGEPASQSARDPVAANSTSTTASDAMKEARTRDTELIDQRENVKTNGERSPGEWSHGGEIVKSRASINESQSGEGEMLDEDIDGASEKEEKGDKDADELEDDEASDEDVDESDAERSGDETESVDVGGHEKSSDESVDLEEEEVTGDEADGQPRDEPDGSVKGAPLCENIDDDTEEELWEAVGGPIDIPPDEHTQLESSKLPASDPPTETIGKTFPNRVFISDVTVFLQPRSLKSQKRNSISAFFRSSRGLVASTSDVFRKPNPFPTYTTI